MKYIYKSVYYFVFLIFSLLCVNARADSDFDAWKRDFYQEALKAGISRRTLNQAVPQMDLLEHVIKKDTHKPEFVHNFYDYLETRVSPIRINRGREMLKKYPTWLSRVEKEYGVPGAYLLALWGMETNFGTFMGSVDPLDSLATLAYHPRRRSFFTKELIAFLQIMDKEPTVVPKKGSWDGGFGNFQFMPTTFLSYAVDADGNGRRDIVNNMPDSFASAANFLRKMGWRANEPWGREIIPPKDLDWAHLHKFETKTVAEWENLGVRPKHLSSFPKEERDIPAEWHMPMGGEGPIFLTYPNYKVIGRWNKFGLYPIATGILADVIENRYAPPVKPSNFKPFRTTEIMCMQERLAEQGFLEGEPDGQIGPKTRAAVHRFQEANNLRPDAYPTHELLIKLRCQENEN